jgi:hypothetical protein
MSNSIRFAEGLNIMPVLGAIDTAASAVNTALVDLDMANWLSFLLVFGNCTSDDTDVVTLTVTCSTAGTTNATEQAIPFSYRISGAVGTNTWGTITAGTSDGAVGTSDGGLEAVVTKNALVIVDVDPAVVAAKAADMRWVYLTITPTGPITLVGAVAVIEPRYPGNSIPSSS